MPTGNDRERRDSFHFVMIKPTHYDDDGYPIQWLRSAIPSNTLACLNGLARGRAAPPGARPGRRDPPRTPMTRPTAASGPTGSSAMIRTRRRPRADRRWSACSPTSSRARSIWRGRSSPPDLPVCIGGFHVSGCLAMLPEMPPEMREAQALGISFFAGEAEDGRLDEVLRDACERQAEAALQLHERPAGARGRAAADPAAQACAPHLGLAVEHRSRPRLPVPVLVLHHHQRAGPQEPLPLARRSRADHPRELRRRASSASSSPTTISPATATGSRCSTG